MAQMFLVPARAGSKGLPGKNTRVLLGKSLILYSLEYARALAEADDLIVFSSNDTNAIDIAENNGFKTDFIRPDELSTDTASGEDVIFHALDYYKHKQIDTLVLLQPTSPYRLKEHFIQMKSLYSDQTDMVVSVVESKQNPYFNLFEEENGYLVKSKPSAYTRRQDCPPVYQYNGSIYIINVNRLREAGSIGKFKKTVKYVMDQRFASDIDTEADFLITEYIMKQHTDIGK